MGLIICYLYYYRITTTNHDARLTPFSKTPWVSRYLNVSILDFTGAKDDGGGLV